MIMIPCLFFLHKALIAYHFVFINKPKHITSFFKLSSCDGNKLYPSVVSEDVMPEEPALSQSRTFNVK